MEQISIEKKINLNLNLPPQKIRSDKSTQGHLGDPELGRVPQLNKSTIYKWKIFGLIKITKLFFHKNW